MTALLMLMSDEEVARFGRDKGDAGFGALRTERGLLPLVAMEVDAKVAGVMATTDVVQTFVNTTGTAIEATYIFPLPDRAAVHTFRMEVAGRVIDGVIEERAAAREQYDQAIAAGHRAAITEEERPGVFTLRVGNLMPGETATVRLSLVGPLPVDDGEVTFRFPLVVAPRYMPGSALGGDQAGLGRADDTDLVPDASRISPPVLLPGCPNPVRLGLRVALEDAAVRDVASSLHAVTLSRRDAQLVEVKPGERLDRDFILRWRIDGEGAGMRSQLVCADDADGRAGTFLLTIVPPSTAAVAAKPRDVVFVIDRSGSMDGWKMVAARRAAARMIDTLTSRDRFCALAFDNAIEFVPDARLVDATDRNRYRAVEALAKIESRGGTEMAEPLQRAAALLAGGFDDRERVIVLVTDGQVGNEDHILRELAPGLRNVRMFTLGIDQAVNAAFLRRLAGAGGGLCELVESEDRLDAVMAKVHRRIGTPIATELALRGVDQLELDASSIAPKKLPDVYAGAPVTILGRYRGSAPANGAIHVTGTSLGDPLQLAIVRESSTIAGTWLAASWARAAIRDREDQYAAGSGARDELEREIVTLSKRFSVLSRFTAFLAIDRTEVANRSGQLRQVVQPVETPAGWEAQSQTRSGGGGGMFAKAAKMVGALGGRMERRRSTSKDAPAPTGAPADAFRAPMSMPMPTTATTVPTNAAMSPPAKPRPTESSPMPVMPEPFAPPPAPPALPKGAPMQPAAQPSMLPPTLPPMQSPMQSPTTGAPGFGGMPGGMPSTPGMPSGGAPVMPGSGLPPSGPIATPPVPPMSHNAPAAVPPAVFVPPPRPQKREGAQTEEGVESASYLAKLQLVAAELETHGKAVTIDLVAVRLLRQRLVQWVEDLRSVGGSDALAAAVERLVHRLSAALGLAGSLAAEVSAIARELAELARGATPPPAPKKSRAAFWK
jgi:Ca-activated chloride channel homolog